MATKTSLIHSLYQIGAVQFGEFKLKSGQSSSIYLNLRKIISYPALMRDIAHTLWESLSGTSFDLVCGVPYTALPIASCLSLDHDIPMIMRRKEKKDYGTKQMIEGEFKPGQRCLVIEDVITTGGSILETAADLENAGLVISDVIALIDREQGGRENLEKKFRTHTILPLSLILRTLLDAKQVGAHEKKLIEQFLLGKSAR